jgi:hypothetical protein
VKKIGPLSSVRNEDKFSHYGKQHGRSLEKLRIEPLCDPAIHFWVYIQRK